MCHWKVEKYTIAIKTEKQPKPKDFLNWNTGKWKSSNVNGREDFIL